MSLKKTQRHEIKDLSEIKVNGNTIIKIDKSNTTTCFKAFINYCIDFNRNNSKTLSNLISKSDNDPKFGKAKYYNRIVKHSGFYYSTYKDSNSKIKQIQLIAEQLNLDIVLN